MPPTSPSTTQLQIDPAVLQQLRGLDLRSRRLVRGLYNNRHRTSDHGSSTEFIEHREYRRGDEIRSIDWRVFARTDRHYVKVHEHEANLSVHLVVDTSDSMRVPAPEGLPTKLELACTVAGAIGIMAETKQDAVGMMCVADRITEHMPARQGKRHLGMVFQHLGEPKGTGHSKAAKGAATPTGQGFAFEVRDAAYRFGSRGMVFLITDALDDPVVLFDAMKLLRAREQDVTLIHILDQNELEFPFDRMTEFRHPETNQRIVGDPAALRDKYLQRLQAHLDAVEDYAKRSHAEYLRLSNHEDLGGLMALHFIRRLMQGAR